MTFLEEGLRFGCQGDSLVGVLARPVVSRDDVGVVVAVGGPQYRVGSHRQFVLLSRRLAEAGYPALRFDVRGMGDSTGEFPGFEALGPDLQAAVAALQAAAPGVQRVVVWGLCDAASAAMMQARDLHALAGLVLLNPWTRNLDTHARTEVKQYYAQRLFDPVFWRKLLSGRVRVVQAARELSVKLARSLRASHGQRLKRKADLAEGGKPAARSAKGAQAAKAAKAPRAAQAAQADFRERMALGALACAAPQLYVLSGRDHVSAEFVDYARGHVGLSRLWARADVERLDLPQADHTFSSAELRAAVEKATLRWLDQLPRPGHR
jgi:exosortase A-associated hydrolase 1